MADRAPAPVVDVVNLRMSYGDTPVLTGVDLQVHPGEVVCLLGPNGAGKTTTIEVLEGFRARSSGQVQVLGEDPATAGEVWRARVGVVLQSWRDHPRWTPRQLLGLVGEFYAPWSTPARPRPWDLAELLGVVGLSELADRKISSFSGGQRRRLDVAMGIVGRPELLFLDEPTAGFDPEARRDFHDLVHRLADLDATSILLTTHDLDEAEKLADRVLVLSGGRIVADASPAELARRVGASAQVTWVRAGERCVHATEDATAFVRELVTAPGPEVTDLEVRRASLEDAYLALVRDHELGRTDTATTLLEVR